MKKITSLTLMALTLCLQHESHAMYSGLRNYAGRIGQQCTRLYNQGAQRIAPAYQTLTTGFGQRISNFRPQASQWFRNMQASARNWRPSLNLPTARTAALGLALGGAGLGATYMQRPDLFGAAKAEEETSTETSNIVERNLDYLTSVLSKTDISFDQLKRLDYFFIHVINNKDLYAIHKERYTSLANRFLNKQYKDISPAKFKDASLEDIKALLNHIIIHDISIANMIDIETSLDLPNLNLELPEAPKNFLKNISKDNTLKAKFITAIDNVKNNIFERIKKLPLDEQQNAKENLNSLFNKISKEIQGSSSWWSYFGY